MVRLCVVLRGCAEAWLQLLESLGVEAEKFDKGKIKQAHQLPMTYHCI
jgi:pyrroloquinoline quinone (PQQ) biosynthesis protein C